MVTCRVNACSVYDFGVAKPGLRDALAANVARVLRQEREARGLSMNIVAQRAGLSHSIVSLIERDMRSPTLDTLLRICEAMDVELADVLREASRLSRR